jgi:hypothetical protein
LATEVEKILPMTAIDMVAKENADYSPKAIPCLSLAMSAVGGTFRTSPGYLVMFAFESERTLSASSHDVR